MGCKAENSGLISDRERLFMTEKIVVLVVVAQIRSDKMVDLKDFKHMVIAPSGCLPNSAALRRKKLKL